MATTLTALTTRFLTLPNGVTIEYVEQGDPGGLPVVLLHGVTDSWWSWSRVLPELPPELRVVAISQRGHGNSGKPDSGYRPSDMAADVELFLAALGIPAAVVVGHSMGAGVALRLAIDRPDRVLALVLIGAFADMSRNAAAHALWPEVAAMRDPVDEAYVTAFQRSTLAQPVPQDFFDWVVRESLKVPARVWRQAFAGFLDVNVVPELATVGCPALIVWGEADAITPREDQDAFVSGLSQARLVVYEGAGHGTHWEFPARFAADLVAACRPFVHG